jgi:glycosyltransferase involved in cell wall biosynthesis
MTSKKNILFLVPYPTGHAPSQRFRVELFLPYLDSNNYTYTIAPFLDEKTYAVLYNNASVVTKTWGVVKGFVRRAQTVLFKVHRYDYVFVHREASPVGPPVFEFLLVKVFGKKMIYDFDDAIWIPDSKNSLLNWFKAFWKVKLICRWAHKVICGNDYLCNYARGVNKNVVLIPTCVDTDNKHKRMKNQEEERLSIGWTGSHSTLRYLDPIVPVLNSLAERFDVRIIIICNKRPQFFFKGLEYIPWNETSEIDDLLRIHIGIMPLQSDKWSEGKCGFKLVQYLSLGIPAVASAVGVNSRLIEEGVNGFLCKIDAEWEKALTTLIKDVELRKTMGDAGRRKVVAEYSRQAYETAFLEVFT